MITEAKGLIFIWNGPRAEPQFLDGQDRALWSLRRGGKGLALATTATRTSLMGFLGHAGVQPTRFDNIFTRKEIGPDIAAGQPMLTKTVDAFLDLGLLRNQIVLVGDTAANMHEATTAKIGFIAAADGEQRDILLRAGAAPGQIIPNLKALPDFLGIIRYNASL